MTTSNLSRKPRYNLSLIVQETGLKADTLRAWERRYQVPLPERTEGGHRLYSEYDLALIKWLLSRQEEGMRISQAAAYYQELLESGKDPLVPETPSPDPLLPMESGGAAINTLREKWISYCLRFEEENAESILSQAFAQFPMETVCTELILPGMAEVGQQWYEGTITVQQEHFTSELVIKKIQALISSAPKPHHAQRVLIGCPPGENHTVMILMINLLLRYRGWDVIYLGANVPTSHLIATIRQTRPDLVILNASRLATTESLLDTLILLWKDRIPAAFGGWVFTQIPELVDKLPGIYLGNELTSSINRIEELLQNPTLDDQVKIPSSPFEVLIKKLRRNFALIDNDIQASLEDFMGGDLSIPMIINANQNLLQDIQAALRMGDINLLEHNMVWAEGLIDLRDLKKGSFEIYLEAVMQSIQKHLGDQAQPILDWLKQFRSTAS